MRPIDADALTKILTTAIRNMEGLAKFIGCEDDPEIKTEIRTYRDILNGVKEQPTIEPERKKGKWIQFPNHMAYKCSECGRVIQTTDGRRNVSKHYPFCHCGADMRGDQNETD